MYKITLRMCQGNFMYGTSVNVPLVYNGDGWNSENVCCGNLVVFIWVE